MAQVLTPVASDMFTLPIDADLPSQRRPHTPPYTPHRHKIDLERRPSPAPSIHPTETCSPAKLQQQQGSTQAQDTVIVQELDDLEIAHLREVEIIYPSELEEHSEEGVAYNQADAGHASDSDVVESEAGIARKLARMHCDDNNADEAEMRRVRQMRRAAKRLSQRIYKRSHSTSMKSDSEVTDMDALDDHDLSRSARRLRRKVEEVQDVDMADSPPYADLSAGDDLPTARPAQSKRLRGASDGTADQHRSRSTHRPSSWSARQDEVDQDDEMHLSD